MSTGLDTIHVCYVGSRPAAVTALPGCDAAEASFLTTVTVDPDVAVAQLTRGTVDCIVCEETVLEATTWTFLRRVDGRFPTVPVVLRTDDSGTAVPAELHDATVTGDDPERLAATVVDVVTAAEAGDDTVETPVSRLLGEAPEYVAHVERDGTVRTVNAAAAEQLGRSRDAIVGASLDDLVDDGLADRIVADGRTVLETGERREIEAETDGYHYRTVFEPIDEDLFEVVVRDVTPTRRAEQVFREERAFLESVVDNLRDVFFVLDPEFRFVRWNGRVNEVTGLDDAALQGASALDFFTADGAERARDRLAEVVSEGAATAELEVVGDDGEPTPYEFSASLVRDEAGAPRYICGIGRDISERRRTEAELDAAIAELERSNTELEQFAYVASHDLKEPLRMVSSYLQLLERRYGDALDEDGREFLEFAVDGAERMQDMIRDLLEYSRVGRTDGAFERVDCERVLETVCQDLEVAIDESDATVEVGSLPTVQGDRSRLVELFQNLLGNAIKYSGEEPPHVEVTATDEGDAWVFAVADNGRGIPEDRIDRVFDLFYRSDVQDSTGIGLALVQKIARSHGGGVRVESTPGEGSTFYVELPRTAGEE